MDLVEFAQEQGLRCGHSRLAPVGWPLLFGFGILWLLGLDHLRRSTSRYQPKRADERSLDQMNDGGGRGVESVVLVHRGRNGGLDERMFCARKA